jgi:TusE/DsrC/DsvC family sulfur relay protein
LASRRTPHGLGGGRPREARIGPEPQWNEQIAEQIARENGVPELTDRHWLVVKFMRERYLTTGTAPSIRSLGKESGVPIKELYQLFPKGPAKLAAKIGGIPKPKGCI